MKLVDVLNALSSLVRTGWMLRGVPASIGETVSQHSYTTALLTLLISERLRDRYGYRVDVYRATTIALIHDLGEAYIGDIVPMYTKYTGVREKRDIELEYVRRGFDSETIRGLYEEYYRGETIEARIVRLADRLSTYLKALEYRRNGYRVDDIVENTWREITTLADELGIRDIIDMFTRDS